MTYIHCQVFGALCYLHNVKCVSKKTKSSEPHRFVSQGKVDPSHQVSKKKDGQASKPILRPQVPKIALQSRNQVPTILLYLERGEQK